MKRFLLLAILTLTLNAKAAVIETVAGGGVPDNILASAATVGQLGGLAYFSGSWYFTVYDKHVIMRVDGLGTLHLVAGSYGNSGYSGDDVPA